jgi:hypothetical protein
MLAPFPMPETLNASAKHWGKVFLTDPVCQALLADMIADRNTKQVMARFWLRAPDGDLFRKKYPHAQHFMVPTNSNCAG